MYRICYFIFVIICFSCSSKQKETVQNSTKSSVKESTVRQEKSNEMPLFERLSSSQTGIDFMNENSENAEMNILSYEYYYNGGGVAIGDINNDGLDDIYFTANQSDNALYLNKGDLKFENITKSAQVAGTDGWDYGTCMVDVNQDGFLDIYVCESGAFGENKRRNLLYINNGDLTFTEEATEYGIDDPGYSTQALFFDFDQDNDLDLYLLNHARDFDRPNAIDLREKGNPNWVSDKFYENKNGRFSEITDEVGIRNNAFGLSASLCDVNYDGLADIYVANDYIEPDFLYINNGDGTFSNQLEKYVKHISKFSMGSDFADINNDGLQDFMVLDMIPESHFRQKTLMGPDDYETYHHTVEFGFYHQIMRNMLQLGNGRGFSEIGEMAGVSKTDWSWTPLFADFDNDGLKDLFISNGYKRDVTNIDFQNYFKEQHTAQETGNAYIEKYLSLMKTKPQANYIYKNKGDLTFEKKQKEWGLKEKAITQGAAYADLDNDGDLDLILNNISDASLGINKKAFIYKNKAREQSKQENYIQINLTDSTHKMQPFGAKVLLVSGEKKQLYTYNTNRGYISNSAQRIHVGLGSNSKVDKIEVFWPDGQFSSVKNITANQRISIDKSSASAQRIYEIPNGENWISKSEIPVIEYVHQEDDLIDFKIEPLLPHKLSLEGPGAATADVNNDGRKDVFIGGAHGQASELFIQQSNGSFKPTVQKIFGSFTSREIVDALFADFDADGDMDLYLACGGAHAQKGAPLYKDKILMNDGNGNFSELDQKIAKENSSCVVAADFDRNGTTDLFVGSRSVPRVYPLSPKSQLYLNKGEGNFKDISNTSALAKIGMITDAKWIENFNEAGSALITVGEYESPRIWQWKDSDFTEVKSNLNNYTGWWKCIVPMDLNNDGKMDFIAGNHGLNSRLQASKDEPVEVHYGDFNSDGVTDAITSYYVMGKNVPLHARDELFKQMTMIRKKYLDFESYARHSIDQVLGGADAKVLSANFFSNAVFINKGQGNFEVKPLPNMGQIAPLQDAIAYDYDKDGDMDVIAVGNSYTPMVETGRNDASYGWVFENDGNGNLSFVPNWQTGFYVEGDCRRIFKLGNRLIIIKNDDAVETFKIQNKAS